MDTHSPEQVVAARQRRRETREALSVAAAHDWMETVQGYMHDANDRAMLAFERASELEHTPSESCAHCTAIDRYSRCAKEASRWCRILQGDEPAGVPEPYVPRVHRIDVAAPGAFSDETVTVFVEDDERMQAVAWKPIDFDAMEPRVAEHLSRTVSYAPNWCWEEAGVVETVPVHKMIGRVERHAVIVPDHCKPGGFGHEWVMRNVKVKGIVNHRSKIQRHYPGTHYIGSEREYGRIAVLTVWLERRQQWAVYACKDGGRNAKGFTVWKPFEWTLIEHTIDERDEHDFGVDRANADWALEVAYLKAKELRSEWGQVAGFSSVPLPFSPERLNPMVDAQANDFERHRQTAESEEY